MHYLHSSAIAHLPLPTGGAALNDDNLEQNPTSPILTGGSELKLVPLTVAL